MYSKAHTSFRGQEDYIIDTSSDGSSIECGFASTADHCQRMKNLGIYRTMYPSHQNSSSSSYKSQRSQRGGRSQRQRFTYRKLSWNEFLTLYLHIRNRFSPSSSTPFSRPSSSSSSRPSSSSSSCSSITTSSDSGISIVTNASIPWCNPNMPQKYMENRVPVDNAYPSLRTQNLILSRMQTILEYACFHFAEKFMPDILRSTGWICPEAGELSVWIHHFYEKCKLRQLEEMNRHQGSQISFAVLLNSVKEIRHDSVHRNPLDAKYLSRQMSHAVTFCQVLGVSDALHKLQSIQLCAETQIRKLGITTEVNIKFGDVSAERGLDVESQTMDETQETFGDQRAKACKTLEKLLLDPKTIDFNPEEEEATVTKETHNFGPTTIMTVMDITPIAEVMPKERPDLSEVAWKLFFNSILMISSMTAFFIDGLINLLGSGRSGIEKTGIRVLSAILRYTLYCLGLHILIRSLADISNDLFEHWVSHLGQWVGFCISVYSFCLWMAS